MAGHVMGWLQEAQERMFGTQAHAASGRRILRPSDDPTGTARVLTLRSDAARNSQYLADIGNASSWLGLCDSTLAGVNSAIEQLRDLAIQGANLAPSEPGRQSLAAVARQVYGRLVELGNTKVNDRYLLAGQATATKPLVATGGVPPVAYAGAAAPPAITISDGLTVEVAVTADQVFNLGGAADPAHEDLFAVAQRMIDLLENGGSCQDLSGLVAELDFHFEQVLAGRGEVGSRAQTCNMATSRLRAVQDDITAAISSIEDADLTEVLVELAEEQNAYQAAAGIAASLHQFSLMDYLW